IPAPESVVPGLAGRGRVCFAGRPRSGGDRGMTQKRVLVLGSGMIGSAMAMDLARQGAAVTVADVNAEPLSRVVARYGVGAAQADLSDPRAVRGLAEGHDLVIG